MTQAEAVPATASRSATRLRDSDLTVKVHPAGLIELKCLPEAESHMRTSELLEVAIWVPS